MNDQQLIDLISEYNENEQSQRERLLTLWREMRTRPGGEKYIQFGVGNAWRSGVFDPNIMEQFAVAAHIDTMCQFISDFHL